MDTIKSKFSLFFQSEKKKIIFIAYTAIVMILLSFIFYFISCYINDTRVTFSFLWQNILAISFFGLYLASPQLIASYLSEIYRKYFYLKTSKKILSLISSISFYAILAILLSFILNFILIFILSLSETGKYWAYILISLAVYVFVIWLVSLVIGITSLISNSKQAEVPPTTVPIVENVQNTENIQNIESAENLKKREDKAKFKIYFIVYSSIILAVILSILTILFLLGY